MKSILIAYVVMFLICFISNDLLLSLIMPAMFLIILFGIYGILVLVGADDVDYRY